MNPAIFATQINEVESILKRLGLVQERNKFPNYQYLGISRFRNVSYRRIWETCYKEELYDFILSDQSILQFRAEFVPENFHYAYYEAPHHGLSYEDFLVQDSGFPPDELVEIGDSFRPEYETALATAKLKEMASPIRYDFEPALYFEGIHPASHVHIGHANNIRIATKKLLRPISFLLFILRQMYPEKWREFWKIDEDLLIRRNVRTNLDDLTSAYWNSQDEWEMVLT